MTDTNIAPGHPTSLDYSYSMQENLLKVENLSVSYDVPILRNLNLSLENIVRPGHTQGQINAIIGPSGMGKSQLFRCIAGLQKPDAGSVLLNGQPVEVGMVGMVYQDYPLFEHLTVWENITLAAKLRTPDKPVREKLCRDYLAAFGMSDKERRYPHELSGGQRQRISIIQQVVSCGHTILMDEPFSGLDILRKEEVQLLIQRIAAAHEHNSVIITTHDIQAAMSIADMIHILGRESDGKGGTIPGARIVYSYNLMDLEITWRPDNHLLPQFSALEKEIRARFHEIV